MRLIDADSLRDRASEYTQSKDEYERFCKIIESEPTAYDVDAVVEEVKDYRDLVTGCYLREIVERVRKGGIDGKEEKQA